jgi:hypothetical protein
VEIRSKSQLEIEWKFGVVAFSSFQLAMLQFPLSTFWTFFAIGVSTKQFVPELARLTHTTTRQAHIRD